MRRIVSGLLAVTALAVGAGAAQAHDFGGGWGDFPHQQHAIVYGTVVSVDATAGTFVANAAVLTPEGDDNPGAGGGNPGTGGGYPGTGGGYPGSGPSAPGGSSAGGWGGHDAPDLATPPALTQVTISSDANTRFFVNRRSATIADLIPGARFIARFVASPTDTLQSIVAKPAVTVLASSPRQLYAFEGTVTAVDPSAGTVTVNVAASLPSGLVPAGSAAQTFAVGPGTLILGGTSTSTGSLHDLFGGTISNVSVGDVVAGGVIGSAGETLAQVEASPLSLLLDLPVPASTGTTSTGTTNTPATTSSAVQSGALHQALALLEGGKVTVPAHNSAPRKHRPSKHAKKSHKAAKHH